MENSDLQNRNNAEKEKSMDVNATLFDLKRKIAETEREISIQKSELESITSNKARTEENIAVLKKEVKESNEHIKVITQQNKELTSELKEFERQSEEIRRKLENKSSVQKVTTNTTTNVQNVQMNESV